MQDAHCSHSPATAKIYNAADCPEPGDDHRKDLIRAALADEIQSCGFLACSKVVWRKTRAFCWLTTRRPKFRPLVLPIWFCS